jgi:hypothetical protein
MNPSYNPSLTPSRAAPAPPSSNLSSYRSANQSFSSDMSSPNPTYASGRSSVSSSAYPASSSAPGTPSIRTGTVSVKDGFLWNKRWMTLRDDELTFRKNEVRPFQTLPHVSTSADRPLLLCAPSPISNLLPSTLISSIPFRPPLSPRP